MTPTVRRTLLVALALLALSLGGLRRGLWTPDEPREAEIAREMWVHPGVIPTLNGEAYVEKPPLYDWLVTAAFDAAGGPSAAAARAVSGIASLLTLAMLGAWTIGLAGGRVAAIAVLLLATTSGFAVSTHWVRIDATLALFVTVAVAAAWRALSREGDARSLAVFYAALAAALWTKGLIGPVLVAAGLLVYAAMSRSFRVLAPLRPVVGLAAGAAAVAVLAGAIAATGGREALWQWGYVNHVRRFVDPEGTGHKAALPYYLWTLPLTVLPWLLPVLDLVRPRARFWARDAEAAPLKRYLAALVLGGLAVLTLASTKREVYLLPLLPPLAFLAALGIADRLDGIRRAEAAGRWLRFAAVSQLALVALAAIGPPIAAVVYRRQLTVPVAIAGAAGAGALAVVIHALRRRDAEAAVHAALGAAVVGWAGILFAVMPLLEPRKDLAPFVAKVCATLPAGDPVYAVGEDETLLGIVPFATGRRVVPLDLRELDAPGGATHLPEYVVVQSKDRTPPWPGIDARYQVVASQEFGTSRRIALWKIKESG